MRLGAKWAIGLLCAFVVLWGAVYRWPIRSARVNAEMNQTLSPGLGLHWRGPARSTFALLPWPTLRVVGMDLVDSEQRNVLSAPAASFPLSLSALWRGRLVPTGAVLRNPTVLFDLDAAPAAVAEQRATATGPEIGGPALWTHVALRGGVLRIVSARRHFDTLIENVEGNLDWPTGDKPLRVALAGAWRDESVKVDGRIDNPREAIDGRSTGLRLEIESRPLSLTLNGAWSGDAGAGFAGDVSAQIHSLSALERLVGAKPPPFVVGDALSLEGKLQSGADSLALSDGRFELAGQKFDGALTLSRNGARSALSGTLAADALQIAPLIEAPVLQDARGAWSAEPFAFAPPRDLDLDLRISIAHAEWRGHHIEDAAASLLCNDGKFTAKLLEASVYQGSLQGELTFASGAHGLEAQASGTVADADLGAALADFGWGGYRGRGGFEFALRSTGVSPSELVAALSGTASIDLQAGVVEGVSIEEAMRRSQRRPIDVARDMATGQTAFTRAHAQFAVDGGRATIMAGRVEGPGAVLALQGDVDMAARALQTRLTATQADAQGAPSVDAARLTIVLSGPWSSPSIATAPGG